MELKNIDSSLFLGTTPEPATSGLTFSEALTHLKAGKRLTRAGWHGLGQFLFLVPGSVFNVNRAPLLGIFPEGKEVRYHSHIDIKLLNGDIAVWSPSNTDVLADDWSVIFDGS